MVYKYIRLRGYLKYPRYLTTEMSRVKMIGKFAKIDASTRCQLKCPTCPTSEKKNKEGIIGWGNLEFGNFKKFLDENPGVNTIELSNWGEIFLNPGIEDIFRYAYLKGVRTMVGNGVNLNRAKKEVLECLVKYECQLVNVSIDGATNEIYQKYRRGGNFETVLENIKLINQFKKKYKSVFPILVWQFVVMGHNENQLLPAKKMAKELQMIFFPKLSWDKNYSPIKNPEFVKRAAGMSIVSREGYRRVYKKIYHFPCCQFWIAPQINWDGKFLGCTMNQWADFGNVFEQGFAACLENEKFVYAKKMLLGKAKPKDDIPCSRCGVFKKIANNPLKKRDIICAMF